MHGLFAPAGLRACLVNWEEVAALAMERLRGTDEVRLFSMLGAPMDITAQELRIESDFPADRRSEALMRLLAC